MVGMEQFRQLEFMEVLAVLQMVQETTAAVGGQEAMALNEPQQHRHRQQIKEVVV